VRAIDALAKRLAGKITTSVGKALKLSNEQSMQVFDIVYEILRRRLR